MNDPGQNNSGKNGLNIIGKARRRVDGRAKVTGQTRFADDLVLPRMLHCKLLRSPLPHARIVQIDVSRALAMDGVHLVLTGGAAVWDLRVSDKVVSRITRQAHPPRK